MDIKEAIKQRHSVRRFKPDPIENGTAAALSTATEEVNRESGLHFQIFFDEPEAFNGNKPGYGAFAGCKNYLALVADKSREEDVGYYGEKLVLFAQTLGVNSCWVALTYKKGKVKAEIADNEKLHMVIALGYGETQGVPHRSKTPSEISDVTDASPEWYKNGLEAVLLAPTAVNQQKFRFRLENGKVKAKPGVGFYTLCDLGIAKYHFEIGSDKDRSVWA